MRCGGLVVTSSSRSSDSARCAPRLVGARAWISSMITTSTPVSVSRAEDVSMRYRLSGVVISRSGGRRMSAWRSLALVSPVRTPDHRRGEGEAVPLGGQPDAGHGRPQVLLDVERQGPQRRDVQDPGPARLVRHGAGDQPVDGREEGRERLAAAGRGADQRVIAIDDGWPPLDLCGRGHGEGRGEPGPDRGREPLQNRVLGHAATLPTGCRTVSRRLTAAAPAAGPAPARPGPVSRRCVADSATQLRETDERSHAAVRASSVARMVSATQDGRRVICRQVKRRTTQPAATSAASRTRSRSNPCLSRP